MEPNFTPRINDAIADYKSATDNIDTDIGLPPIIVFGSSTMGVCQECRRIVFLNELFMGGEICEQCMFAELDDFTDSLLMGVDLDSAEEPEPEGEQSSEKRGVAAPITDRLLGQHEKAEYKKRKRCCG